MITSTIKIPIQLYKWCFLKYTLHLVTIKRSIICPRYVYLATNILRRFCLIFFISKRGDSLTEIYGGSR